MEAVGARMGRSSTRYGPATVFSGPVRKWTKKWVPVSNPDSTNHHQSNANNGGRSNNKPNLHLFKWAPISSSHNNSTTDAATNTNAGKDSDIRASASVAEEPHSKKFRYVPVAVIEEQKDEAATDTDDETKPIDADPSPQPTQSDGSDVKPDINDVSMEVAQMDSEKAQAAELVGTNLDLSLGLKAHDGESKTGAR